VIDWDKRHFSDYHVRFAAASAVFLTWRRSGRATGATATHPNPKYSNGQTIADGCHG
jgi:hypothetical protein